MKAIDILKELQDFEKSGSTAKTYTFTDQNDVLMFGHDRHGRVTISKEPRSTFEAEWIKN